MDRRTAGLLLVAVGIIGLATFPVYAGLVWSNPAAAYGPDVQWNTGMMGQGPQIRGGQISFDQAAAEFRSYVNASGNKDLGLLEVMEFENNFYGIVYEKSTGIAAFELLIWKRAPSSGMMGGGMGMGGSMMGGVVMPEPGPNMMWNTKYSMMRRMMGSYGQTTTSGQMTVSEQEAKSIAESYLSRNFPGAHVEGITRFYGYYTIDFERNDKILGMLSVNGYTGEVWYHSWHGYFIQEKDFS